MATPHYRPRRDEADVELVSDAWPKFERFIYILSPLSATRANRRPARRNKAVVHDRRRLERWYRALFVLAFSFLMVVSYSSEPRLLVFLGGAGILLSAAALGVVHERLRAASASRVHIESDLESESGLTNLIEEPSHSAVMGKDPEGSPCQIWIVRG